jgi:gephyrin
VKENLEALLDGGVVEHAVELVKGGSGAKVHMELAAAGGKELGAAHAHAHSHHGHHHHHDHKPPQPLTTLSHDPSLPGTTLPSFS